MTSVLCADFCSHRTLHAMQVLCLNLLIIHALQIILWPSAMLECNLRGRMRNSEMEFNETNIFISVSSLASETSFFVFGTLPRALRYILFMSN